MNRLFLHPGAPKTATSTLQRAVFRNHSQIHYLGKVVPSKFEKGCRSQAVFDIMNALIWERSSRFDPAKTRERLQQEVFVPAGDEKTVVASWEALILRQDFASLLSRFDEAGVELNLLVTLRNPLTWLASFYLQTIQGQYIKHNKGLLFRGRPYLTLEEYAARWTERRGSLGKKVNYLTNVRHAIETLGPERVGVVLFEELRSDADDYYRQIANILNIDAEEAVALGKDRFSNLRLQQSELDFIRKTSKSPLLLLRWHLQDPKRRRARMREVAQLAHDDAPAKVKASDELLQKITDATRDDLAWLNANLDLPFAKYGYPV